MSYIPVPSQLIRRSALGIDLKVAVANNAVPLGGSASQIFVPLRAIFTIATATALNGAFVVAVETSAAADDIVKTSAPGAALTLVNDTTTVTVAGIPAAIILGTASLNIQVATADGGTSGTMDVHIEGYLIDAA